MSSSKINKDAWRNSNLSLIGSDIEQKIKAAAAVNEPQWENVGEEEGLNVWRIEKFIVKPWPRDYYGEFHTGDSYIVLNTFKEKGEFEKLCHDIHIWIGDESSQDEYGTAAYKMVELDDKLGGIAVQHRETQAKESDVFLEYFKNSVKYLEGGIESGFRHVEPSIDKPHMYRVKGKRTTLRLTQVPIRRDAMNSGDVFILAGNPETVWVWVGSMANKYEKAKAGEIARTFRKTGKEEIVILDEGANDTRTENPKFWEYLPTRTNLVEEKFARKWSDKTLEIKTPPSANALMKMGMKREVSIAEADSRDEEDDDVFLPVLYSIIATNGNAYTYDFITEAKNVTVGVARQPKIDKSCFATDKVYIFDTGFHYYVWVGKNSERDIKIHVCEHVHNYCQERLRPISLPLSILKEGMETNRFQQYLSS